MVLHDPEMHREVHNAADAIAPDQTNEEANLAKAVALGSKKVGPK